MQFRHSQVTEPDGAHFPFERRRGGNRGGKSNLLSFQKENRGQGYERELILGMPQNISILGTLG